MCDATVQHAESRCRAPWEIHFFRESGERLEGRFVRYDKDPRPDTSDLRVAVIQTAEGTLKALYLSARVLSGKFAEMAPAQGDQIEVVYKGERLSFSGRTYNDFEVRRR